ncbi:hypothetical protein PSTT_04324 [Puccinia striiformis]|uniref:Uncharacterized protein n=1 Tax=Puccinia striiformis TaxID=27350 RepID=A0A2S4VTH2_9BASI|nr:hypothetical protein PSTT_04324 [Puccinia striiformis]
MDQTPRPRIQSIKIPSPKKSPSIDNRRDHNPHRLPGWSTRLKKWSIKWEVPRKLLHTSIDDTNANKSIIGHNSSGRPAVEVSAILEILQQGARRTDARAGEIGALERGDLLHRGGLDESEYSTTRHLGLIDPHLIVGRHRGLDNGARYGKALLPSPPFAPRKSVAGFLGALVVGSSTAYGFWSVFANRGVLVTGHHHSWMASSQLLTVHHRETLTGYVPTILNDYLISKIQLSTPNSSMGILPLSLACGIISALAESWNLFGWDDNLVLPILSGWGIWGIMKIF